MELMDTQLTSSTTKFNCRRKERNINDNNDDKNERKNNTIEDNDEVTPTTIEHSGETFRWMQRW